MDARLCARRSHRAIIFVLTYFVGLGQFTHVVARSVEVLYLVMTSALHGSHWAASYFLPTLLGNVLDGVSLVSVINHAQIVSGRKR